MNDLLMRLGGYDVLIPLGRGGMADVYIACANGNKHDLVILKQVRSADEKTVAMFRDEASIARLLHHPNVVCGVGTGEEDGRPFLVLEYVDGQPVDQLIRAASTCARNREEIAPSLLWILTEALAGLQYAHELTQEGAPLDLVHRDFSPQNLFVGYEGQVKVLDFGIAKTAQRFTRTTTGVIKGKLRYMAPEQALGMRVDRRADIFSTGVMLWEFVSGTSFWAHRSDKDVFDDLVGGVYHLEVPNASSGMNAILRHALARAASDRYSSAAEMRSDLVTEMGSLDSLKGTTTLLVDSLFGERRERMTKLLERARVEA